MNEWYNQKIEQKMVDKFKTKFGSEFSKETWTKIAKEGNYDDFCLLCTVLKSLSFSYSIPVEYGDIRELKELCNNRVDSFFIPEILDLYNEFLKTHELWVGDQRYEIFAYGLIPNVALDPLVRAITIYIEFYHKNLSSVNDVIRISTLVHGSSNLKGDGVYFEGTYAETSKATWEQNNKKRQTHCEKLRQFAKLVYNKKYDEAYKMFQFYEPRR